MFRAGSWVNSLATGVVLGAASIVAAQPLPAFTTRMEISTAVNDPTFLRTVDFDGDGDQDIVSTGQNVIRLLLSDGAPIPSFIEVIVWSFVGGGANVAVGDLDGDGDLDVVSSINAVIGANPAAGVYWHENLGGNPPAFTTQLVITGFSDWIELADVNGDTKIDIIITQSPTDDVVCFLQDPLTPGAFSPPVPLIAGTMDVRAVIATDLDGDGDLDLVLSATFDKAIRWLENIDGSGVNYIQRDIFVSQAPSATASKISIVDFDGDQRPDILSTWGTEDLIRLHRNLGGSPPAFETTIVGAATAPQIAFGADLDGDTFTDIVSISSEDDSVRFWRNLNTAPPTFAEEVVTSAANMGRTLSLADMDGDADLDIVSGSAFDEAIRWYRNDSDLSPRIAFQTRTILSSVPGVGSVAVADFANTGSPSIASTSHQLNQLSLHRNLGGNPPIWSSSLLFPSPSNPLEVAPADVDGDGFVDMVVSSLLGSGLRWYRNDGGNPPTFIETIVPINFTGGARGMHVVDLDQDSDPDIVLSDVGGAGLVFLRNQGGSPVQFQLEVLDAAVPNTTSDISSADVDGDGDMDLLFVSNAFGFNVIRWYENVSDNPPVFTPHDFASKINGFTSVCGCDMDSDGDVDIAVGAFFGAIFWFENMDGVGLLFNQHEINSNGGAGIHAVMEILGSDFDRDGDCDLLSAQLGGDAIRWHENVGAPSQRFVTHVVSTATEGGGVAVGDFNGDGQIDVASANNVGFGGTINWHENLFRLPGDFNDDGLVNAADLASLLAGWGPDQGFGADLTGDGIVNAADLAQLLANWTAP